MKIFGFLAMILGFVGMIWFSTAPDLLAAMPCVILSATLMVLGTLLSQH